MREFPLSKVEIKTADAPQPVARFSQGVRKGNILQVAGQVAFDPSSGEIVGTTVAEQTRQTFANLHAVLAAGGASIDDVVMIRVYLTDTAHFAELNEVYGEFVTDLGARAHDRLRRTARRSAGGDRRAGRRRLTCSSGGACPLRARPVRVVRL